MANHILLIIFKTVPFILILYFYWKSACILNELSDVALLSLKLRARDLYIYCFTTILTSGPMGLYFTLNLMNVDTDGELWDLTICYPGNMSIE